MDGIDRQSRSDDTSSLNQTKGRYWLVDIDAPTFPEDGSEPNWEEIAKTMPQVIAHMKAALVKTSCGFNNDLTGRWLCPVRYLKEYDADPVGYVAVVHVRCSLVRTSAHFLSGRAPICLAAMVTTNSW